MTKPIGKSKRQLAQLLIEAGVTQFPEGVNWAWYGKKTGSGYFGVFKPVYNRISKTMDAISQGPLMRFECCQIPNWHQTVLSRDEFDQIVAETAVPARPEWREGETVFVSGGEPEPTTTPTLDQLLQDWRNADDYAQRKQTEADEAAAMRDERWQAVQVRAGEMGVTVEPELVITDWRDLQVNDEVECVKYDEPYRFGRVVKIDTSTKSQQICVRHPNDAISWPTTWRFIRRP